MQTSFYSQQSSLVTLAPPVAPRWPLTSLSELNGVEQREPPQDALYYLNLYQQLSGDTDEPHWRHSQCNLLNSSEAWSVISNMKRFFFDFFFFLGRLDVWNRTLSNCFPMSSLWLFIVVLWYESQLKNCLLSVFLPHRWHCRTQWIISDELRGTYFFSGGGGKVRHFLFLAATLPDDKLDLATCLRNEPDHRRGWWNYQPTVKAAGSVSQLKRTSLAGWHSFHCCQRNRLLAVPN